MWGALVFGQEEPQLNAMKVAFIYNFISYTNWPSLPSVFHVCLLGEHSLDNDLAALWSKEVRGRPIQVRNIIATDLPGGCHLVFLAASEQGRVARVIGPLSLHPVLTVADFPIDNVNGPLIGLSLKNGRLRFSVNNTQAQAQGLGFSSRLLWLALSIR